MVRKPLFMSALAASTLSIAPQAHASVNFGSISCLVNRLHSESQFQSNNFAFSVNQGGSYQNLFTGVSGLHDFLNSGGLSNFNNWANQGCSGSSGSSSTGGYHFTYTVLGSYFGNQTGQTGQTGGATVQSASFHKVEIAPVPEPATWAMMIFGFGLVGMAMRRRRRTTTHFA